MWASRVPVPVSVVVVLTPVLVWDRSGGEWACCACVDLLCESRLMCGVWEDLLCPGGGCCAWVNEFWFPGRNILVARVTSPRAVVLGAISGTTRWPTCNSSALAHG